eukprot:TRINITY_DN4416_c0_g1_i3.p1 TRINITY_DN4416_c0_g1~~TRINITY_DN4416_c0_g1_i3.p1  ORF type:complete len:359 (-),score=84.36 TRINITY_DN4416_c0_g1_i3:35-1111(-)
MQNAFQKIKLAADNLKKQLESEIQGPNAGSNSTNASGNASASTEEAHQPQTVESNVEVSGSATSQPQQGTTQQKQGIFGNIDMKSIQSNLQKAKESMVEAGKQAGTALQRTTTSIKGAVEAHMKEFQAEIQTDEQGNAPGGGGAADESLALPPVENPAMFGIPLEQTLLNQNGVKVDDFPRVVSDTIRSICQNKGYLEEGIFRLSTSHKIMHEVKRKYDLREEIDSSLMLDPHLPACLLKLFLRELKEPLFTMSVLPRLQQIPGLSEDQQLIQMKQILAELPLVNQIILREIFSLLSVVAHFQLENKMTEKNLAIIFVPAMGIAVPEVFIFLVKNSEAVFGYVSPVDYFYCCCCCCYF